VKGQTSEINTIINKTTTAIGTTNLIQSLMLPLGESLTILLAVGKIRKNMATRATADAIFSQSIMSSSKNKPP
jgi:hypothetical protein